MKIKPLDTLTIDTWHRVVSGYVSHEKYAVSYSDSGNEIVFRLKRMPLEMPYHKQFEPLDASDIAEHKRVIQKGFSFGAYVEDELIGLALALPQEWNNTLWLQEFHIAENHQGNGVGRALMQTVIEKAKLEKFRLIYLETQNTNVPAIRFYRQMGFAIERVDLSFHSNEDYPDGEIALFMKYKNTEM